MLGRSVMGVSFAKNDPSYPFEKVANILKTADIVLGNLENPIISNCPLSNSDLKFCADPKMIQGLKYGGIDILNLANNHTKNYGDEGFTQTENYLKDNGIDYIGAGNLVTQKVNGVRFGFLGFDFIDNKPQDSDYDLIANSKKEVDVLIVMVHWGLEYSSNPTDDQKSIAGKLVTAGADIVAGTHPHVIQEIDYINGKPVFYSLGNFIFDQMSNEATRRGLSIRLWYSGKILSKTEELRSYMNNFAQPEWSN